MKIQLVDRNKELCDQWEIYFQGCEDVIVHNGDFFSLKTDCVVSPANSFGFMDGGLDYAISLKLGWQVQNKLQSYLRETTMGELLVGQAILINTDFPEIPFCISAPTMRVPLVITNTTNVYLAAKAIFILLKSEPRIQTVTISGLGTGVGRVPYDICAKQMKEAYTDVWLDKYEYPTTWHGSSMTHHNMFEKIEKL